MKYILDTNTFIDAKNRYYDRDFCPAFWDWLAKENKNGVIFSISKVADELKRGNDWLKDWAESVGTSFFVPITESIAEQCSKISQIIEQCGKYAHDKKAEFYADADYYILAAALAEKYTVVSHEQRVHKESKNPKIKIPDVCDMIGADCINTFELLKRTKARFILAQ